MIERWSDSTRFKVFLTIAFSIGVIIVLPLIVLFSPFIIAWDLAGAFIQKINSKAHEENKLDFSEFLNKTNKWDKINFGFNSWKDE